MLEYQGGLFGVIVFAVVVGVVLFCWAYSAARQVENTFTGKYEWDQRF